MGQRLERREARRHRLSPRVRAVLSLDRAHRAAQPDGVQRLLRVTAVTATSDAIQVWDPVNPANNVARTYTEADRQRLVTTATSALEEITWAAHAPTKGEANDAWRSLLGPGFEGA